MSFEHKFPEFKAQIHGDCIRCSEKDVDLFVIPDLGGVCKDCLENDMDVCDVCGIIYDCMETEFTELDDGRTVCEWCLEEVGEE